MASGTVVGDGYRALHKSLTGIIWLANSAKVWRFRMCGRLSVENILLERSAQHLEHVAAERRQLIPKDHARVGQRHLAWRRHLAPFDQAHIRDGVVRGAHGRVMINAVRPATRCMREVSMASVRVIAGKIVVSRRANIDFPAPGGPGGGYGQNACMTFSFTCTAGRNSSADGSSAAPKGA